MPFLAPTNRNTLGFIFSTFWKGRHHSLLCWLISASTPLWRQEICVCVCVHFNGQFPGEPWLAGTRMSAFWTLSELRVTEVVVTTGAKRRAKLQSKCHHQQTNIQFLQAGCPSCRPTNSVIMKWCHHASSLTSVPHCEDRKCTLKNFFTAVKHNDA